MTKELKNARARIRGLMQAMGPAYSGPTLEQFYLNTALERLKNGTHINTIYAEIRNATAAKIRKQAAKSDAPAVLTAAGEPISRQTYNRLNNAINKANKNIRAAAKKYGAGDVMPAELEIQDVLNNIVDESGASRIAGVIRDAFTPKKLVPKAINDNGEAGTEAEIEYLNNFIQNENARREKAREYAKDTFDTRGRLLTQQEFDMMPVNTDQWDTMEKWRRRTDFFTDAADYRKADLWLTNYITSLNKTIVEAKLNGADFMRVSELANQIFDYVSQLKTAQDVRNATIYSDRFQINLMNYFDSTEAVDMLENILSEWETYFNGGMV